MIIDRRRVQKALPGYALGAELGSGAFGLVLAGKHRRLGRPVAIKVMQAEGPEGRSLDFAAEARVLAGFDHPHVVKAYDYVEAEGLCLVVMELLAGGTLSRRRAGMTPQAGCAVGLAVAAALEHAHSFGVLHRDIKGDNILFTADGIAKVADFGIAKLLEGSGATASSRSGTPMYMAPEQIDGGRLGPATDLYALGVVMYQLLTGAPPFDPRQSVSRLWRQHLTDPPPPMIDVPAPLAAVVLRALAKKSADRQPDARTFALELAAAAATVYGPGWAGIPLRLDADIRSTANLMPAPIRPPSGMASRHRSSPAVGRTRFRPRWVVAVALAALAATSTLVALRSNNGSSPTSSGTFNTPTPTPAPGPAAVAVGPLSRPAGVAVGGDGSVYIADIEEHRVWKVDRAGRMSTLAGTGTAGFSGDGGPANRAQVNWVAALAVGADSSVYMVDSNLDLDESRIRKIDGAGRISTIAGNGRAVDLGESGSSGDGGPALDSPLSGVGALAVGADGVVYLADEASNRIRRVDRAGLISTFAGAGTSPSPSRFFGDGGPATRAQLDCGNACGVAVGADGSVYIADEGNNRIRKVDQAGRISTIAGNGSLGFAGDGGLAIQAQMMYPLQVAVGPDSSVYILDDANDVRKVDPSGRITLFAGNGTGGFSGDGGPATRAQMNRPSAIAVGSDGSVYIADEGNKRIRKIDPAGRINTIAR
ncbi:serine/threonine-protein kinase [Frankia sp. AvcI1]|uniref:serine/threonine-protein kinase n=1 Tax=Frankia sp. AvcI1 TaxID=573496 RepID=UPI0021197237|nr:serine/threonine-protein kinase [Frankia sp. AvcI1]